MWRNNQPADETEHVAKQSAIAKNVNPENPSNNHKMKRLHNSVGRLHNSVRPKKVKRAGAYTHTKGEKLHYSHGPIWFLFKQVFNLTIFSRLFFCLIAAFSRYVRYFSGSCFMRILYNLSLSAGVGLPLTPMADVEELPIRLATPQLPPTTGKKQSGCCTFWHFLPVSYRQLVNYAQCS